MYLHSTHIVYIVLFLDVKLEDVPLNVMTNKWQIGAISNYDYLLYLNKYVYGYTYTCVCTV